VVRLDRCPENPPQIGSEVAGNCRPLVPAECENLVMNKLHMGGKPMSWSAPKIKEINCGMEINMYAPSEDERRGHEPDLF
jgi:coenzyme PQQ precursor peptide PqqA